MKAIQLIFVLIGMSVVSSCDLLDDSPCGPKQTYDLYQLGSSIVDITTGVYYSYMEGNNRVFQ